MTQATQSTWTTDETGHLIGDDGFVVPRDFGEFYEVGNCRAYLDVMAYKLTPDNTESSNVEDTRQFFVTEMLRRRMVDKFDPAKLGGCNERRFYFYLGTCLRRIAHTRYTRTQVGKRKGEDVAIDDSYSGESSGVTHESIHEQRVDPVAACNLHDRLYLDQFRRYVCEERPKMSRVYMRVLDGIAAGETQTEMGDALGCSPQRVHAHILTLRRLAAAFVTSNQCE